LLLAADLPFLDAATVHRLLDTLAEDPALDAAVLVDADGREQLLTAAYRTAPLRAALAAIGSPDGARLRAVTARLRTRRLADTAAAAVDCDTWEDVERARDRADRADRAERAERAAHGAPSAG
jgi:molybdopterin-guanine dinucleotide biosynthesis protein A